jgi:hypothetical protein
MATITNPQFQIHKDINGYPSYLRTQLVSGVLVSLAASVPQVFTVPNGINLVIFSKESGNTLYVLIDNGAGSITLPSVGSSIANSYIDINVVGVNVIAGQVIHLMSPIATTVKINYYNDGTIQ